MGFPCGVGTLRSVRGLRVAVWALVSERFAAAAPDGVLWGELIPKQKQYSPNPDRETYLVPRRREADRAGGHKIASLLSSPALFAGVKHTSPRVPSCSVSAGSGVSNASVMLYDHHDRPSPNLFHLGKRRFPSTNR